LLCFKDNDNDDDNGGDGGLVIPIGGSMTYVLQVSQQDLLAISLT